MIIEESEIEFLKDSKPFLTKKLGKIEFDSGIKILI